VDEVGRVSGSLRILGRPSSINVRKVLWTADEAGVPYVYEPQWGTAEAPTRSAEFLALNPNALVPVLVDENGVLWESNAICRYLAARARREDLLPSDPAQRAKVEQWMDWQATELNEAWRYAFMALMRRHPDYQDAALIQKSASRWNKIMRLLDRRLETTGAFVAGDEFTLADIVIGLSAHRWRMTPIEHASLQTVDAWLRRLDQRPAFRRWTADP
jgi:glutathione S-transferase